jgi:acyl dehydratase
MAPLTVSEISELKEHVGTDLGKSQWTVVDQARIDEFARATGDHQWIHVDVERAAAESPFGGTVAHGYLTVSIAAALLPELLTVERCSRIINYGIDKLRLKEPVHAGSRLRVGGTLTHVREIGGGGARVTFSVQWEVEGARRPVCTAEVVYVYFR